MFIVSKFASKIASRCGLEPGPREVPLAAGQAATLQARHSSCLVVLQGRAWATLSNPAGGSAALDHVLNVGDALQMPAGALLVMEAWPGEHTDRPLRFRWNEVPVEKAVPLWLHRKGSLLLPRHPATAALVGCAALSPNR